MMAYKMTFRCPDCRHEFKCILSVAEKAPDYCPSCGVFVGTDPAKVPEGFNIGGSVAARSVDQMWRQTEETSAARAAAAGDPSLKITNMRDNVKIGETAAMPVNNLVSQTAEAMRSHNHEKNAYYSESMQATVKLANTGLSAGQGDNPALRAIQGSRSPRVPTAPKVAGMSGGFGGGVR